LQNLHAARYELVSTAFSLALARGLIATGRKDEARSVLDASIRAVEANGDAAFMPELLRVKSQLVPETERTLQKALEFARSQTAMGWELRAATDLAAHLIDRGRPEQAHAVLKPALERFTEGFETADLERAAAVLMLAR